MYDIVWHRHRIERASRWYMQCMSQMTGLYKCWPRLRRSFNNEHIFRHMSQHKNPVVIHPHFHAVWHVMAVTSVFYCSVSVFSLNSAHTGHNPTCFPFPAIAPSFSGPLCTCLFHRHLLSPRTVQHYLVSEYWFVNCMWMYVKCDSIYGK